MSRRLRTECPRCGKALDKADVVTELVRTKAELKKLRLSVASMIGGAAKAARLEQQRVERVIKKARSKSRE